MSESAVPITPGTGGASIASDLVSGNNYQQIKVVDGTLGSNNAWKVNSDGSAQVSVVGTVIITGSVQGSFGSPANQSVSGTVGASVLGTVPVTFVAGSNHSVSGTVGASILGAVNFQFSQNVTGGDSDSATQLNIPVGPLSTSFAPIGGANYVYNGGTWDRLRGNSVIGVLVTPYTFPSSIVSGVTSVITGTASVQVLLPAAGGQRNYITQILVTNGAAVGTFVSLYDGGNVLYSGYAAASGGGFSASFPSPLKQSSIAGNLSVAAVTQASIIVSASGYTAP